MSQSHTPLHLTALLLYIVCLCVCVFVCFKPGCPANTYSCLLVADWFVTAFVTWHDMPWHGTDAPRNASRRTTILRQRIANKRNIPPGLVQCVSTTTYSYSLATKKYGSAVFVFRSHHNWLDIQYRYRAQLITRAENKFLPSRILVLLVITHSQHQMLHCLWRHSSHLLLYLDIS